MAKNTKIPVYSFDLWENFPFDKSAIPVATLTVENDFGHFPSSLDIANYLAEHKGHFLTYMLTKSVTVFPSTNIRGAVEIQVKSGQITNNFLIINIRQIK